ncbi:MAG: DUF1330 domain-containing protein [Parvularculaceae bacterium]|nr:DUF1330 domain-containing protein [Parvularculaceae bacterium]
MELGLEGPVRMLNLIRLRKSARYEDGRKATGAEAYAAYARESAPFLAEVGGRIVLSGRPQAIVIGPEDERWDVCFVAEYPSAAAFATMVKNPGYQAIVHHRQAAVKDSRLIAMSPGAEGKVFG